MRPKDRLRSVSAGCFCFLDYVVTLLRFYLLLILLSFSECLYRDRLLSRQAACSRYFRSGTAKSIRYLLRADGMRCGGGNDVAAHWFLKKHSL